MPGGLALSVALALLVSPGATRGQESEENCQLNPSDDVVLANQAIQEARTLAADKAAESYQEALKRLERKIDEKDGAALLLAAQAAAGLADYVQADRYLDDFVLVAPACAQPANNVRYNAWAQLYNDAVGAYQEGDRDRALELFDLANVMVEDARSLNNAAFLYREKGETETAIDLYRRAAVTQGPEAQVRNAARSLAEILSTEDRGAEAIELFGDYLAAHPDDALMKVEYAVQLAGAGREAEATPLLDEVLGGPDLPASEWNMVGVTLYNAQHYGRAATAFGKAYEANPYDKNALENLVTSLVENDKQEEALPLAETLVERYPYDEANYQLLANALANTNNGKKALQVLQQSEYLTLRFESLQLESLGDGQYIVSGVVRPREASAGTTVTIPFELLGAGGEVVASRDATLELPAADEAKSFELTVAAPEGVVGFRYRKAGAGGIQG